MPRADQIFSLTIIGGILFALVPLASAQGQGDISEEAREAINSCKQKESREDRHECMQAIKEENGLLGFRMRNRLQPINRPEISSEAREALGECKNIEDKIERRKCVKSIAEEYDIAHPFVGKMRGRFMRGMSNGLGDCLRMEDRNEAGECFLKFYDRHRQRR